MVSRVLRMIAGTMVLASAGGLSAQTINYSYDAQGRLVQVQRTGTPQGMETAQYSYDPADNRTRVLTNSTNPAPPAPAWHTPYSFELPNVGTGYAYNPVVEHITFAGISGVAGNGSAFQFIPAPDGTQVAFLQSVPDRGSSISLRFGQLSPGRNYLVRFRLAQRPGYGINPITVYYNGAALRVNGSGLYEMTPPGSAFTEFTTFWFVAGTETVTIEFRSSPRAQDSASGLDSVSLQES